MRYPLICLLLTALLLTGCTTVSVVGKSGRGLGPPPHAPAHGHRHQHRDATLVFDAKVGVYVVAGHDHHFYWDGRFLRLHAGAWQVSASLSGPWRAYAVASLPPGLRVSQPKAAKRHKHKWQPPAKGRW